MSDAKELIAEAKRRSWKIDLPCVVCKDRPLREWCGRCLAHDLAVELEKDSSLLAEVQEQLRVVNDEAVALRKRVAELDRVFQRTQGKCRVCGTAWGRADDPSP